MSLSSKVFESEITSCPKLPGANLILGGGFFFMERFEDESGDMSSGGAANEP